MEQITVVIGDRLKAKKPLQALRKRAHVLWSSLALLPI